MAMRGILAAVDYLRAQTTLGSLQWPLWPEAPSAVQS